MAVADTSAAPETGWRSPVNAPGSKPRLTVVVPVYNGETHVGACLQSISAQSFEDFEVIVVDDGSQDGSRAVAEAHAATDPRFRVISTPNGGVSRARNVGLDEARGDYITFVDADDWLDPTMYKELLQPAEDYPYDAVAGDMFFQRRNGIEDVESAPLPGGRYDKARISREIDPMLIATDRLTRDWPFRIVTKVFRLDHLREHGIQFVPDLRAAQDFVFSVDAMSKCSSFYYFKGQCGYHYRWNPTSRTRSKLDRAWSNYREIDQALAAVVSDEEQFQSQLDLARLHGHLSALTYTYRNCSLDERAALKQTIVRELGSVDHSAAFARLDWRHMSVDKRIVCVLIKRRHFNVLNGLLMLRGIIQRRLAAR